MKRRQIERMLREAIQARDIKQIGELVEMLRFGQGANYEQCYSMARRVSGITLGEWDELLYEADHAEED